jgi:hypothetical protein
VIWTVLDYSKENKKSILLYSLKKGYLKEKEETIKTRMMESVFDW